jgi:SAM-dependent methyltransferase
MDPAAYDTLERIERDHWYYRGKREIVAHWLEKSGSLAPDRVLLDCGAGTGLFASEMAGRCRVLVLDDHEESLARLRRRFPADRILSLSGERIPLPDASVDAVTALDVLEHVGADRSVVEGFERILKPGGVAIVTVPASMALWSDWDVMLHHHRRYDLAGLKALFPEARWTLEHAAYTNSAVYPAVWLVRRMRGILGNASASGEHGRFEDRIPPSPVNALLRGLFTFPARLGWRLPFGVSLLLVARLRAG